jgi:hypothetical protein
MNKSNVKSILHANLILGESFRFQGEVFNLCRLYCTVNCFVQFLSLLLNNTRGEKIKTDRNNSEVNT